MSRARAALLPIPLVCALTGCALETIDESATGAATAPIVGGGPASAVEMFGTVALLDPTEGVSFCSATLVAPTLAVTAAHCVMHQDPGSGVYTRPVDPSEVVVAWGALDADHAPAANVTTVARVEVHSFDGDIHPDPDLNPEQLGRADDIALLILAQPISGQGYVPILPESELDNRLTAGTALTIAGFGRVALEPTALSGVLYTAVTPFVRRNDFELVAGGDGQPDACGGDSGGPAYLRTGSLSYLVGTASRSSATAVVFCGQGGIWTLAPAYESWIAERSGGAYPPPPPPASPEDEDEDQSEDGCGIARPARSGTTSAAWALWLLAAAWCARRRCVHKCQ